MSAPLPRHREERLNRAVTGRSLWQRARGQINPQETFVAAPADRRIAQEAEVRSPIFLSPHRRGARWSISSPVLRRRKWTLQALYQSGDFPVRILVSVESRSTPMG